MPVKRSARVESDIIEIYVASVRQFGLAQAGRYLGGLDEAFLLLAEFPMAARERTEIAPPVRIYAYGAHLIIYVLRENDEVYVLRVRHSYEDWQRDPG